MQLWNLLFVSLELGLCKLADLLLLALQLIVVYLDHLLYLWLEILILTLYLLHFLSQWHYLIFKLKCLWLRILNLALVLIYLCLQFNHFWQHLLYTPFLLNDFLIQLLLILLHQVYLLLHFQFELIKLLCKIVKTERFFFQVVENVLICGKLVNLCSYLSEKGMSRQNPLIGSDLLLDGVIFISGVLYFFILFLLQFSQSML